MLISKASLLAILMIDYLMLLEDIKKSIKRYIFDIAIHDIETVLDNHIYSIVQTCDNNRDIGGMSCRHTSGLRLNYCVSDNPSNICLVHHIIDRYINNHCHDFTIKVSDNRLYKWGKVISIASHKNHICQEPCLNCNNHYHYIIMQYEISKYVIHMYIC